MTETPDLGSDPMQGMVSDLGGVVANVLSSEWVIFILVPLLVIVGAVLLKALARRSFEIKPEDKFVGFDLGITACITLLVSSLVLINKRAPGTATEQALVQHYLIGIFIVFILFLLLLVGTALVFRKNGWEEKGGQVLLRNKWLVGVDLIGLILLVVAFNLTGGSFK